MYRFSWSYSCFLDQSFADSFCHISRILHWKRSTQGSNKMAVNVVLDLRSTSNTSFWLLLFFKKLAYHGLFLFIFVLFKHKFLLKQDLSSDCRNRRQASWPLDHPLFAYYASQFYIVCLNSISSHSYANFHMNDAIGDDLICFVVKSPLLTLM